METPTQAPELPFELITWIFSFLPFKDVMRCRGINSSWSLAFNSLPWKQIIPEYPGGLPSTRKDRKLPLSSFVVKAMVTFHEFNKNLEYEKALHWAAMQGHHALITQLLMQVSPFLVFPPPPFAKVDI